MKTNLFLVRDLACASLWRRDVLCIRYLTNLAASEIGIIGIIDWYHCDNCPGLVDLVSFVSEEIVVTNLNLIAT